MAEEQVPPLELVARGAPLAAVLDAICRLYERHEPRATCSIYTFAHETLYFAAGASVPRAIVDGLAQGVPVAPHAGACGTAVYHDERVISADIAGDPDWTQWARLFIDNGLRACWSSPIRGSTGQVLGSFAVYYPQPGRPRDDELELVDRMTHLAGIAMERQAVLDALRESEERYRSLVEGLSEAIFQTDGSGRLVFVSAPFEAVTGVAPRDALGRRPADLVHADDRPQLEDEVHKLLTGRQAAGRLELRMGGAEPRDGDRWIEWRARPQRLAAGRVRGITGILADVTERKALEAQLVVSERMASMGTLVAGVAHEINNPLAALILNLDYLQRELQGEARDQRPARSAEGLLEPLRAAAEGAERVREIVRNLKIFSRGDERRRTVDVHAILESTLRMTHNEIRHRARVVKDYGDIPYVEANEAGLGQVFMNLLVNAAQAIPEGHADRNEVRVTTRRDAAGRVVVEVRDTGAGIAPQHLGRIFDPFFTTKPVGVGTGLGLAICHRIVSDLGGEISVESAVGAGSRFRVTLPASPRVTLPRRPSTAPHPVVRRGQVLVVDDEVSIGEAVQRLCAPAHDVTIVTSGAEALARIRAGARYDVILCDLMMPTMSGVQLHAEIAGVAPELLERMVFITGGAFTPAARAFLEQVPNPVLDKPFDGKLLAHALRERLR